MDANHFSLVQHDSGIHSTCADRETPDRLTVACIDTDQGTIPGSRVEHALSIQPAENRTAKGVVLRGLTWACTPNNLTRLLVKGIQTVHRRTIRTPVTGDATDDDQILFNRRCTRTAIGECQTPKRFHHWDTEDELALRCVGNKLACGCHHIDISSFGIHGWATDCVAIIGDVREEVIETMLPEDFSCVSTCAK